MCESARVREGAHVCESVHVLDCINITSGGPPGLKLSAMISACMFSAVFSLCEHREPCL